MVIYKGLGVRASEEEMYLFPLAFFEVFGLSVNLLSIFTFVYGVLPLFRFSQCFRRESFHFVNAPLAPTPHLRQLKTPIKLLMPQFAIKAFS